METEYKIDDFLKINAAYSFVDLKRSDEYIPKYGLSYLKNKLSLTTDLNVFETVFKIEYLFKNYLERTDTANLINVVIERKIDKWLKIEIKTENLLNYYFEEIKEIPARGRIISGKVKIEF